MKFKLESGRSWQASNGRWSNIPSQGPSSLKAFEGAILQVNDASTRDLESQLTGAILLGGKSVDNEEGDGLKQYHTRKTQLNTCA